MDDNMFKEYKKRLVTEGIIKSVLIGLITGSCVDFMIAFIVWMFGIVNGAYWIALGIGVGVFIVSTPVYYFCFLKPTPKGIAKRLDKCLGLEERMITMHDYSGVDSVLVNMQRTEAAAKLVAAPANALKAGMAVAIGIAAAVTAITLAAGTSMTVAAGLMDQGHIKSGIAIVDTDNTRFEIVYEAGEGGYIDGDAIQFVLPGQSGDLVLAVPDDGWGFVGWEKDGAADPARFEKDVKADLKFTAIFAQLDPNSDQQGEGGDGDPGDPGDMPVDPNEGEDSAPGGNGGNSGGASERDNDNYLDGKTHYTQDIGDYYDQMREYLDGDNGLTEEQRQVLEAYFEALRQKQ